MLIRIVVLFLVFMLILGMVQKWLRPGRPQRPMLDKLRCPTCKRVNLSNNPVPCDRADCRYR